MREQMPIDSDASGDGLQVEIESGPRQSPTHNARPFSSDEEQTKTLNPSDSEAHPSDPNIGKALAGHQPAPQPEPIKPQDVVMNKHERQAKIAQIKDSMKKSENKKEFWDFWTIPLAVVGCSIGVVLIGYGIHHYYPSESAIEDIIDMEVTIEDEL